MSVQVSLVRTASLGRQSSANQDRLFVGIDAARIARAGCVVSVPPQIRAVILALAARPNAIVSADELIDLVFGDRPDGGPDDASKALKVLLHHARDAFCALGYRLETSGHRGYSARPALFNVGQRIVA
jgi:DNA-binding winged helix-turn-helix (wHTH) protein